MTTQFIVYKRVSTQQQGIDGYGMGAQDRDIEMFMDMQPSTSTIIQTFTEVESGSNTNRPELSKAVSLAKSQKATLLVSKLDRLSRRVRELATLMEVVNIKVAMMPNADNFQLHIYAALAEQERQMISQRTKAALTAAKARGVKVGVRHTKPTVEETTRLQASGVAGIKRKADEHASTLADIILPMRQSGMSFQKIADALNGKNITTPRGNDFTSTAVRNITVRLAA